MVTSTYTLPPFHVWAIIKADNLAGTQVRILEKVSLSKSISQKDAHSFYGTGEMLAAVRPNPNNPSWGYCTFECGGYL
jgi:hypothetical protein